MSNRTMKGPSARAHAGGPQLPDRTGRGPDRAVRYAAVIAGIAILLMSALAVFGNFVVLEALVTPGDAARTAQDIGGSEGLFRLGVASLALIVVLDVVVAWALFRVFSTVSRDVSRLAAWLRLAYAAVFLVAIAQLMAVPRLLDEARAPGAFTTEQSQALALSATADFKDVWDAGLILFGLHLLVLGYLVWTSGSVPRVLGVLLAIGGFGYVFDSLGQVLSDSAPTISTVTFLGEFLLAIWLVVRRRRLSGTSGLEGAGHGV